MLYFRQICYTTLNLNFYFIIITRKKEYVKITCDTSKAEIFVGEFRFFWLAALINEIKSMTNFCCIFPFLLIHKHIYFINKSTFTIDIDMLISI